ncbi:MAG: S41 family peptidase [Desulfurivibrionaceae bacterium]|nr:S41 family peptidase [Pseudomonadota bacterium]MCG2822732.1 S41 family peptidase [Desulfobulbaceae bacterium]MDP2003769.1 S41 family peptidase [Desulfurivibrionaceae bacterium]MDP2757752.1 S41 family peptidase [Desulfurivibrionaceae bacterium]
MKSSTKRSVIKNIAVSLCVVAGSLLAWNYSTVTATTQDTYESLEAFSKILSLVQENYVEEVDSQKAIEGAIKGMLTTLDPHSSYMKPDDFKELQVETQGSFTGIGIEITMKDNILTVVSPIEGTPAFAKGLKAGDKIVKIGEEPTQDMSLMEAVKRLRGPKGSEVTISIHRKGWPDLKEITLIRDIIPIHSVKSKLLEPGYPYIRIINFQAQTTTDFKKALSDLEKAGKIKGLIVDLRNNPGGLLDQSVKVADIFIDEGVIVSTKGRIKEQNSMFYARDNNPKYKFPVVVLVNEGSASASEIVAGALQDHKKAVIVGAQTFGKGSVQTIIPMDSGAGLRLTTARYYTPSGRSIQATGITPDIIVPSPASLTVEHDEKEDEQEKKPKYLREKDLKHHIGNGLNDDVTQKEEKPKPEEKPKTKVKTPVSKEKQEAEDISKDQQLSTALTLLKGLNVFGKK